LGEQRHRIGTWVAAVLGLHRAGRTGVLEVRREDHGRRIFFLRGRPIGYWSDVPSDSLERTLTRSGRVAKAPLRELMDGLGPGDALEQALIDADLLDAAGQQEHHKAELARILAAPLAWPDGTWLFTTRPDTLAEAIDPGLQPAIEVLAALWTGVCEHVAMPAIIDELTDPEAGDLLGRPALTEVCEALGLAAPLDRVPDLLRGQQKSLDQLFRDVGDTGGNLVQLIWLLEQMGSVGRSRRRASKDQQRLLRGEMPEDDDADRSLDGSQEDTARAHVDAGRFADAVPLLAELRASRPASSPILADLGWALWRLRGEGFEEHGDGVDLLKAAFAHDPRNIRALEFLARIAGEQEDGALARRYLAHLRMLKPDLPWVVAAFTKAAVGDWDRGFWSGESDRV